MDSGDENIIRKLFLKIDSRRKNLKKPQTVLVLATLNMNIRKLASVPLKDEVVIGMEKDIDSSQEVFRVPSSLKQYYVILPKSMYPAVLASILLSKTEKTSLNITPEVEAKFVF